MSELKNRDEYVEVTGEYPQNLLTVGVVDINLVLEGYTDGVRSLDLPQYSVVNTKTNVEVYNGSLLVKALFEAQNEANAWSSLCETRVKIDLENSTGFILPKDDIIVPGNAH